jgi:hypothetical protein
MHMHELVLVTKLCAQAVKHRTMQSLYSESADDSRPRINEILVSNCSAFKSQLIGWILKLVIGHLSSQALAVCTMHSSIQSNNRG